MLASTGAARSGALPIAGLCALLAGCSNAPHVAVAAVPAAQAAADSVVLSAGQLHAIRLGRTAMHRFLERRSTVGSIDFNEDQTVQVFPSYQGKILQTFAQLGDEVHRGSVLYTIDSPDLVQAESTLIAAAGVADLTRAALARAQALYGNGGGDEGIAQKDYQQAVSDQMTAEAALKAARAAVRVFGKSEAQIDVMIAHRAIDPALEVDSPVDGRVTARAAQVGLLVQPGNLPAPYSVADLRTMWLLANAPESDVEALKVGQAVSVSVAALPGQILSARIRTVGAAVDPNTHTVVVRSEIADAAHELRSGMIANFSIDLGSADSVAIPADGVVREGDGTMTVWVTTDQRTFTRRVVRVGLQQDGLDQVLEGLKSDELVVTDGAILLSNLLDGAGADG